MPEPIRLEDDYLLISGSDLEQLDGGNAFWDQLGNDPEHREHVGTGWLVAAFPATADWESWEMHPYAHEVVHVTSGRLDITLDHDGVHEKIDVCGGETLIVPAGVWHTIDVTEPGATLNITHGHGTEHRPR